MKKSLSSVVLICMIFMLFLTSCKETEEETVFIPDSDAWYDTDVLEMGREFSGNSSDYRMSGYMGQLDGRFFYYVQDHDVTTSERTSKILAYLPDGSVAEEYDITKLHRLNPQFYSARIIDGEIVMRFYDGDVKIDRANNECVELNGNAYLENYDDYMMTDLFDGLRIDCYLRSGMTTNTMRYQFYEGDELIKEFDMEEYLPETDLTNVGHLVRLDEHKYLMIRSEPFNQGYYEIDLDADRVTDVTSDYAWLDRLRDVRFRTCDSGTYAIDTNAIYKIDLDSHSFTKILSPLNCDIPYFGRSTVIADVTDDTILLEPDTSIYSRAEPVHRFYTLTRSDNNPNAGKKIIRIASENEYFISGFPELIKNYNSSQSENYLIVDDRYYMKNFFDSCVNISDDDSSYYLDASAALENKLLVDLKNGDGPDILFGGGGKLAFCNSDHFVDLNRYIDGDNGINRDDYFDNVLRALERGGKLYHIPLCFDIEMIATVSDSIRDDQTGFTFGEYEDFVRNVMSGKDVVISGNAGKRDFTAILLGAVLGDIVKDDGRIDLNDPAFRGIVTYAKESLSNNQPADEWMNSTANNWYVSSITHILNYCGFAGWDVDDVRFLGLPAAEEGSPVIHADSSVAITSSASDPDSCWDFIKYLISYEGQTIIGTVGNGDITSDGMNLIERDAFNENCQSAVEAYNRACDNAFATHSGMDEGSMRLAGIPCIKAGEDDISTYMNLIGSLNRAYFTDANIEQIIFEEIEPYFAGDKSLDECISVMNNRAQLVLNERS
ncbi:MAG: extracellular solute-binding protein [Clostridiales bacterium]|nr:extracellular solute-binding protein [Clostridiales bacterium]